MGAGSPSTPTAGDFGRSTRWGTTCVSSSQGSLVSRTPSGTGASTGNRGAERPASAIALAPLEPPQSAAVPPDDELAAALNLRELRRYVERVSDRWPIQRAIVGGARVDDANGAPPQRERGPEWVVLLISDYFDGVPWLERVYQAGNLWDRSEMGAPADVPCYTPPEFERKQETLRIVRDTATRGVDVLSQSQ